MNDNAVLHKSFGSVPIPGNATPPVGSMNKEAPAINLDLGSSELPPAEPETQRNIDQELTELEVKEVKDSPDLTSEHKELGVKASGPYVPIPSLSDNVVLSMSEEEIKAKSKTVKSDDAEKWYMALLKKIIGWERIKDK